MRCLLVCGDDFLWRLAADLTETRVAPLWLVEQPALRARIQERGGEALSGRLEGDAIYRRAFRSGLEPVLVAVERGRQARVLAAIRRVAPSAPLVVVAETAVESEPLVTLPPGALAGRVLEAALERATTRARVQRLREHFAPAERVLILMQDDPDPDAIASALALKTLLGRSKSAATIGTFGTITRPENRAMTRLLEIDVEQVKTRAVEDHDMLAIVDAQPAFFEEALGEVDLVIDHHPGESAGRATLRDVRPSFGATSTILTEYLRAAGDVKIRERLATALLYGIKTDTLHLERGATRADMEAFAFLHGLANHNLLRRIERPDLPDAALDVLARGLGGRRLVDGVMFVHLGPVGYPELVAQFADFLLQVEGAEWSVVSGRVNSELHISVRNVGYVRAAGEVVHDAFGDLGGAGGHRSMAKAVIKLRDWRAARLPTGEDEVALTIVSRFGAALRAGRG